jgi:hypothetical protein
MTWTVYGLRLRGNHEARYIGQTMRPLDNRLFNHFNIAAKMPRPTQFAHWLIDNRDEVEAFKIAYADTLVEARTIERVVIGLCLRLEHRLFNRVHVPAHLRLVQREQEIAA